MRKCGSAEVRKCGGAEVRRCGGVYLSSSPSPHAGSQHVVASVSAMLPETFFHGLPAGAVSVLMYSTLSFHLMRRPLLAASIAKYVRTCAASTSHSPSCSSVHMILSFGLARSSGLRMKSFALSSYTTGGADGAGAAGAGATGAGADAGSARGRERGVLLEARVRLGIGSPLGCRGEAGSRRASP